MRPNSKYILADLLALIPISEVFREMFISNIEMHVYNIDFVVYSSMIARLKC